MHFFGAVLVPMLTDWGGLTYTQAMLLQSIFVLGNTLLEIPTGVVADRWGRKVSVTLGILAYCVGLLIYGMDHHFPTFVASITMLQNDPTLRALATDLSVVIVAGRAMIWLYQPLLQSVGIPIITFGWVSSAFVLVELILMVNVTKLDKLLGGRTAVFAMGRYIPMIGHVVALNAYLFRKKSLAPLLAILAPILIIGFGLSRKPFFDGPMNDRIPSHQRATVISTIRMISSAILVVVNPLIGWTTDISIVIPLIIFTVVLLYWSWHNR